MSEKQQTQILKETGQADQSKDRATAQDDSEQKEKPLHFTAQKL